MCTGQCSSFHTNVHEIDILGKRPCEPKIAGYVWALVRTSLTRDTTVIKKQFLGILIDYCRSSFECFDCKLWGFLYNMQSKQLQEKEYTMNSITCDHTHLAQACMLTITNMHAFSISRMFAIYLHACMDIYGFWSSRTSLLRFFKPINCQHANTQPSAIVDYPTLE